MEFRTLAGTDFGCIHKAFIQAFSDYQVSISMPLKNFETMMKRNGFLPEVSAGAFENGELVGFVLNGVRDWDGVKTIYDAGTGVIPGFRGKGITTRLLEVVKELCVEHDIRRYQLEVIQDNTPAVSLYEKQGFKISRALNCYRMKNGEFTADRTAGWPHHHVWQLRHVEKLQAEQWEQVKTFWNYPPSWQNSIDSVCAIWDTFCYTLLMVDGELAGYGIVGKTSGDVIQLAVKPEYRRRGIAAEILQDLQQRTENPTLKVKNVDERDEESDLFLKRMGFEVYVKQYEMEAKCPGLEE